MQKIQEIECKVENGKYFNMVDMKKFNGSDIRIYRKLINLIQILSFNKKNRKYKSIKN